MDFKEVFKKQIPPLPTQMHTNNQITATSAEHDTRG